jgi:hypothetical protein
VVVVVVVVTAVLVVVGGTVVAVVALALVVVVTGKVVLGKVVLGEVVVPPELCRLPPHAVARAAKPPIAPTCSNRRRLSSRDIPPSRYASGKPHTHPKRGDLWPACRAPAYARQRLRRSLPGHCLAIPQTIARGWGHAGLDV